MSATEREAAEPHQPRRPDKTVTRPLLPPDAGDPAHGGGAGQGLRAAQIRRVPAPLHRSGGRRRRRARGAQARRLRHRHVPRARPRLRQGHDRQGDHRRAVRQGDRVLEGPGRFDAPVRRRQELPRRLRHRRRPHPAGGRHRLRIEVPRRRPRHPLLLRRRLRPAGRVPRGRRAGGPLAPAGRLHLREQPLLDGDAALPVAVGGGRVAEGARPTASRAIASTATTSSACATASPRRSAAPATSRCPR